MPDDAAPSPVEPQLAAAAGDRRRDVHMLRDEQRPLREAYDVAMLDLDGVVYRGDHALDHVAPSLVAAHDAGLRLAYVTNNAARTPDAVVEKLRGLGMPTDDDGVVTSAQAAARLVASLVPPGSRVLVVGGEGLVRALEEHGLVPVASADDHPAAVAQGFSPDMRWALLAEGAYAVARDVPWVASNTDGSIPTARGIAPGNGTLVAAITTATGRRPQVAGKPYAPLFDETVLRVGGSRPLVVGDRLDTDIEGANNVGADSLLVMTGVTDLATLLTADPRARPTFVSPDLRGLALHHPPVAVSATRGRCGRHAVLWEDGTVRVEPDVLGESDDQGAIDVLRAAVALAWHRRDEGAERSAQRCDVSAVRAALRPWGVR